MVDDAQARSPLIEIGHTLVVLVDVQDEWIALLERSTRDRFVFQVRRFLTFARLAGAPVVWAEAAGLGATVRDVAMTLADQRPFVKATFSCFGSEELARAIADTRRDTLAIVGAEAHLCVAQTGLDALERGYRVHVVADAVASRDPLDREVALRRLEAAGATMTTVEMAMFELMRRSDTQLFAEVLQRCPPWPS